MEHKENQANSEEKNGQDKVGTDTNTEKEQVKDEISAEQALKKQVDDLNDKYLRLYSEFDNYRKRTLKERAELLKTAAEDVFKVILPVIDDLERAMRAAENSSDNSAKEGISLIYNKLKRGCEQKGLVAFESIGQNFDSDLMEAITHISDSDNKGKVVDEIEKGYKLGDKVIRYAKVVVGN